MLITDLGADGLKARREEDQPFDQQDGGGKGIRFDGNQTGQKMSGQDYLKVCVETDRAYAEAVDAPIAEVKNGTTGKSIRIPGSQPLRAAPQRSEAFGLVDSIVLLSTLTS